MASNLNICGTCDARQKSKPSKLWCLECDEGLCSECSDHHSVSKATRHHETVPVESYREIPKAVIEIAQTCDEHGKLYQMYCNKHGTPCCKTCIIESHNRCQELSDLDEIVKNIKSSSAFLELEQTVIELSENISKIRKDREVNIANLSKTKQDIVHAIQKTKLKVNSHLDKLEELLLNEVAAHELSECEKCNNALVKVKKAEEDVTNIKDNLRKLKEYASNLQTFLGLKHFDTEITKKEQFVNKLLQNGDLNEIDLTWKQNPALENFESSMKDLGTIVINSNPCQVSFSSKKFKQAQIMLQVPKASATAINCAGVTLKLKSVVLTKGNDITGCTMLPDERIVFTSYQDGIITVMNSDGSNILHVSSKIPTFDVVYLAERKTLAVTSGYSGYRIQLFDGITMKYKSELITDDVSSDGISYKVNKLWFCAREYGLMTFNLESKAMEQVDVAPNYEWDLIVGCSYLAMSRGKMYFTNKNKHMVTCCNLEGKLLWQIEDQSVLSFPLGVTVDETGSLYVAGWNSNNVVRISSNGTSVTPVLSHAHGLDHPQALHYDIKSKQLIVANQIGTALIFSVTTGK